MVRVLQTRALWAAVAIVSMWLAVLFTAIYGADIVANGVTSHTTVPVAVVVAFFAVIGTVVVGRHGFGGEGGDGETGSLLSELDAERERRQALEGELDGLRRELAVLRQARAEAEARPQATVSGARAR